MACTVWCVWLCPQLCPQVSKRFEAILDSLWEHVLLDLEQLHYKVHSQLQLTSVHTPLASVATAVDALLYHLYQLLSIQVEESQRQISKLQNCGGSEAKMSAAAAIRHEVFTAARHTQLTTAIRDG